MGWERLEARILAQRVGAFTGVMDVGACRSGDTAGELVCVGVVFYAVTGFHVVGIVKRFATWVEGVSVEGLGDGGPVL